MRSQRRRELTLPSKATARFEAGVSREREAIASNRAEAQELLSMYYQMKGLPVEDANSIVSHIARNPHQLLRALTAQRLNATEEGLDKPVESALAAGIATSLGAFVTVIPFSFAAACAPSFGLALCRWQRISL